jgi:hypothetical protein
VPDYQKAMLPLTVKIFSGGLLLALVAAGCVTRSQANAQASEAYQSGRQAAFASMGGQGKVVVIAGPVEHSNVPWVEGLTLSQAVATAQYTGRHNPKAITITRQGEEISVNPRNLLSGHVVPLQPGDTIAIRE